MTEKKIFNFIKDEINEHQIVLFMKGTANFPQCGFSAKVVNILQSMNIKFKDHNVLVDENLRKGIKIFSDWPTIPQLYIKGEFIGGCDIVVEMYKNRSLIELIKSTNTL